jgi:hypothetical protein
MRACVCRGRGLGEVFGFKKGDDGVDGGVAYECVVVEAGSGAERCDCKGKEEKELVRTKESEPGIKGKGHSDPY